MSKKVERDKMFNMAEELHLSLACKFQEHMKLMFEEDAMDIIWEIDHQLKKDARCSAVLTAVLGSDAIELAKLAAKSGEVMSGTDEWRYAANKQDDRIAERDRVRSVEGVLNRMWDLYNWNKDTGSSEVREQFNKWAQRAAVGFEHTIPSIKDEDIVNFMSKKCAKVDTSKLPS